MKSPATIRKSSTSLVLALTAASSVHAVVTPFTFPQQFQWKCIADTCTQARGSCSTGIPLTNFASFSPPIMAQYDAPLVAFKAWITPGTTTTGLTITGANDEGVWSNGPDFISGAFTCLPNNILLEGDPVPASANTFGISNSLTVRNLQMAAGGVTMCMTNTSIPGGKVAVLENCCLQNLGESPTATLMDIRPPVIDMPNRNIGMWKRAVGGVSGVEHGGLPGMIMPPCIPPVNAWWSGFSPMWAPNQLARIGSPSISEMGTIALYGRDNWLPATERNHIRVVDPSGTPAIVVRQAWPCPPVPGFLPPGSSFGIIHTALQANSDDRTITSVPTDLVAWQMDTMTAPGPSTVTSDSLWCKQSGVYNHLAYQTESAPDIPGRTLTGFYALHTIAVPGVTNASFVFWGARLSPGPGFYAIYGTRVLGGVKGPTLLIATDVPGITPVDTIMSGVQNITAMAPFFSVNARGDVLFKATCAGAPVGHRQVLVTAHASGGHARSVRSQSGMALPTLNCGIGVISNFQLATPDQGTYSRGQAYNALKSSAAKILFTAPAPVINGQGIFIGR